MTVEAAQAIENFRDRNSPSGLFLRYARGRTRDFLSRQVMTLVGAIVIGLFGEPWMGFAALAIALTGEAVDCLTLRGFIRQNRSDAVARQIATATAAFQSVTISACVILCWRFIEVPEARIFAAVFLMAGVINAGLVRRHFPSGTNVRLAIYALAGAVMVAIDLADMPRRNRAGEWFFFLSVMIIAYTATVFIRAVEKGYRERLRFENALLEEQVALRSTQAELVETSRQAERLALVAKHANDSVIFTSPDGTIEWVNEGFTRTTGYSFDEAVGHSPGGLLNAPETSLETLSALIKAQKEGKPCRLELQNRCKDGHVVWMEISMNPVLRPDGTPEVFIAVERDITAAKAYAAELAQARQEAESAAKAKAQFLATMSHEIRTPLNGVIGVAELLEDTKLDKPQRQFVSTIIESGRALLTIINDVLDLSKLQASKVELRIEDFSVEDCLNSALDLLRPTAKAKGLTLTCEIPQGLPRHQGDAGRLRQILLNLIGNALKFTTKGQISAALGLEAEADHDLVRIAIADTGIGIAADRIGHVFESFTQADSSISRQFGGTGLGLTISRLLAEQMGGGIEVASVLGEGSVFTLTLRLPRTVDQPEAEARPIRDAAPETQLRLLVAEDNRINRLIARKQLERSVGSVAEAVDGRMAVQMYCADPPDLVLMDVSMPEMDGMEATRAIRVYEAEMGLPRCPIYALTAYSSDEQEGACLEAGMDGLMTKPFDRTELYALLQRVAQERDRFDLSSAHA